MFQKFFIACLLVLTTGCSKNKSNFIPSQKPTILVSIAPYRFLTDAIAGDEFNIYTVVPDNANPHDWEPTSNQVFEINQGLVWFQIGESFEKKLLPVLKSRNPDLVAFDLREGIEMIGEGCCSKHEADRHVWLNPNLMSEQAKSVERVLSSRFPEHSEKFKKNTTALILQLEDLNQKIHTDLKGLKKQSLLVSHPAFAYFCKEYNLSQLSVEVEGKDPLPKHMEKIVKEAKISHTNLALALPQHNNKGLQLIAKEINAPVKNIDPYSAKYVENLENLSSMIKDAYADRD